MIKTTAMLLEELKEYGSPKSKLSRMAEHREYFPIVKGLYETDGNVPGYLLAGSIYGPSYISFEYALSYYGLIPEAVYTITSATFAKKKKKKFETMFGTFTYRDVPSKAFPLGIRLLQEGEYYYRIAEPEKALCDQLYTISPVSNLKNLYELLTNDLRIERADLKKLDVSKICLYSEAYHTTNVKKLCSLLRRLQREHSN
jgi:predicted transcriptional regulator of viral defense system